MPNILVSLISEQTAPNVLLILDTAFAGMDEYVFITSPQMEASQRLEHLLVATDLAEGRIRKIVVDAHEMEPTLTSLAENCPAEGNTYWVNLTGGTKMMSLSVWAYFTQPAFAAKIFYVSLGANRCQQIYPLPETQALALTYRFSLTTYLRAYGIAKRTDETLPLHYPSVAQRLYEDHLSGSPPLAKNNRSIWYFAAHLQYLLNKANTLSTQQESWTEEWLAYLNYTPLQTGILTKAEITYLNTAWLEHQIAAMIQTATGLPDEAIAVGNQLYPLGQDWRYRNHEFDVLFLYRNRLYVIECKTAISRKRPETKRLFDQALQRLAALKSDFGLNVSLAFVTLSDQLRDDKGKFQPRFARPAQLLGVTLIDRADLVAGVEAWLPILLKS